MASTVAHAHAGVAASSPTYQAYQILHFGFTVAPIIAGLDKFTEWLTDWDKYLAPWVANLAGGHAHGFMEAAGVIEIIAGIGVALLLRHAPQQMDPHASRDRFRQSRPQIVLFTLALSVGAGGAAHAPEVEAEGRETGLRPHLGGPHHDRVLHVPAVEGVRMTEDQASTGTFEQSQPCLERRAIRSLDPHLLLHPRALPFIPGLGALARNIESAAPVSRFGYPTDHVESRLPLESTPARALRGRSPYSPADAICRGSRGLL